MHALEEESVSKTTITILEREVEKLRVHLCDLKSPRGHLSYPSESPMFWMKYGSIGWNEVHAQDMADRKLLELGSRVHTADASARVSA